MILGSELLFFRYAARRLCQSFILLGEQAFDTSEVAVFRHKRVPADKKEVRVSSRRVLKSDDSSVTQTTRKYQET